MKITSSGCSCGTHCSSPCLYSHSLTPRCPPCFPPSAYPGGLDAIHFHLTWLYVTDIHSITQLHLYKSRHGVYRDLHTNQLATIWFRVLILAAPHKEIRLGLPPASCLSPQRYSLEKKWFSACNLWVTRYCFFTSLEKIRDEKKREIRTRRTRGDRMREKWLVLQVMQPSTLQRQFIIYCPWTSQETKAITNQFL